METVVAHYNEDISWLNNGRSRQTIYSKGGPSNAPPYPCHPLPNIGREGHTWLTHIIERYHSLADITIFLQGRIDDNVSVNYLDLERLALKAQPGEVVTFPGRDLERFNEWDGIPWDKYPIWKSYTAGRGPARKTPAQYWEMFFPEREIPLSVAFEPGAQFAVRRETIQQLPQQLYRQMREELFLGDMAHPSPETGHILERFWLPMWNPAEYALQKNEKIGRARRNYLGQLAKGHWHITPYNVDVDEYILSPKRMQLPDLSDSDDSGHGASGGSDADSDHSRSVSP